MNLVQAVLLALFIAVFIYLGVARSRLSGSDELRVDHRSPHRPAGDRLENVWGPGYGNEVNYLKVYAYRIRRKRGDEQGHFLQSDPSVGYRLAWPSSH